MSTPAQPWATAWRVRVAVSGTEQAPVPTRSFSGGRPAASSPSRVAMRSSEAKEVASPVVPKTTRPWQPWSRSQRACSAMRGTSGFSSGSSGVRMGAKTPRRAGGWLSDWIIGFGKGFKIEN